MNNIKAIDLNLLKAFQALMQTGSVTKAAEKMLIGQSAMSHSLGRLRDVFDDELFIRTAKGMEPTARASELGLAINSVLQQIETQVFKAPSFDPLTSDQQFTIAMSDYLELVMLPDLLSHLSQTAPNIKIKVVQLDLHEYAQNLDDGLVDFVIGDVRAQASWHNSTTLFSDVRRCVFSAKQTGLSTPISLDDYTKANHIVRSLAANTTSFIDDELAKLGKARLVTLSTPRFSTLPIILQRAPLIATLPGKMVGFCLQFDGLTACNLPFPAPAFTVKALWHAKNSKAAAYEWFLGVMREVEWELETK